MSKPKDTIDLEKMRQLSTILADMADAMQKAVVDYEVNGIHETQVKNWKTLYRGLVYVKRTAAQICGPASKIQTINLNVLPIPEDPKEPAGSKSTKKADLEKMDEAEAKLKEIRKRKPPSP